MHVCVSQTPTLNLSLSLTFLSLQSRACTPVMNPTSAGLPLGLVASNVTLKGQSSEGRTTISPEKPFSLQNACEVRSKMQRMNSPENEKHSFLIKWDQHYAVNGHYLHKCKLYLHKCKHSMKTVNIICILIITQASCPFKLDFECWDGNIFSKENSVIIYSISYYSKHITFLDDVSVFVKCWGIEHSRRSSRWPGRVQGETRTESTA